MEGVVDDFAFAIDARVKKAKKFLKVKQKFSESFDHHRLALKLLGGKCVWLDCECTDSDINQIDHIFNDGKSERGKDLARKIIIDYYIGVDINFRYQVLCINHNRKKHILNLNRTKLGVTPITIL